MRRRVAAIVAAAGVLATCAVAAAATAGSLYVATDLGAKRHPRTLVSHQPGVTYRFTSLRWRARGSLRPQASGRLSACVNMGGCEKLGPVSVQLRDLRVGRCTAIRGRFYVRGTMIRAARRTPLDLPVLRALRAT